MAKKSQKDRIKVLNQEQGKAKRAALKALVENSRTQVIMPCGTGKTRVGINTLVELRPKRAIIFAPTLALLSQIMEEYAKHGIDAVFMPVCSDRNVPKPAKEYADVVLESTTNPEKIAEATRKPDNLVVFCTYASVPKVVEAFEKHKAYAFDFAVFDEAHNATGATGASFALYEDKIRIKKRLYLTATPRAVKEVAASKAEANGQRFASMDDADLFGEKAYEMSYQRAAYDLGLLAKMKFVVFKVYKDSVHEKILDDENIADVATAMSFASAMKNHGAKKALVYCNTQTRALSFAKTGFPRAFERIGSKAKIWSKALVGFNKNDRHEIISELRTGDADFSILASCKMLTEGVDVPSVDAVGFIDPRINPIEIVQIIGRAVRLPQGIDEKTAYVFVPVYADASKDTETAVEKSRYAMVFEIFRQLDKEGLIPKHFADYFNDSGTGHSSNFAEVVLEGFDKNETEEIKQFVRDYILNPKERIQLTEEMIVAEIERYFAEHGRYPTQGSKELTSWGATWVSVDLSLRNGCNGLPGGSSLVKLIAKMTGKEKIVYTVPMIEQEAEKHKKKYGRYPTQGSKELTSWGATWHAIDMALRIGSRGLLGGSSLAKLIAEMTGKENTAYTIPMLKKGITVHKTEYGRYPTTKSKELTPWGSTWRNAHLAIKKGRFGLPKNSGLTLAKLVEQVKAEDAAKSRKKK